MDCGMEGLTFTQVSLVKPQFADECSISNIISKFMRTGQLPAMSERPVIQSAENLPDNFQDLVDSMCRVRQRFDLLPLEERNKYNNNPELWLEALAQSKDEPVKDEPVKDEPVKDEPVKDEPVKDEPVK